MEFENENVRVRMEEEVVDRISSLPDEIIHHILSFNDTKYAVQTCVLSSRWKLIWTTLPYLKLGTESFPKLPKFYKFVNRLLSLRNSQTEVSSLDLYIRGPITPNHKLVQKIAGYVASHNVQKVKIYAYDLKGTEDLEFPLCFFSSQSIKHLSVETYCHNRIFPLPKLPWDSQALTTVELIDVWLCADDTMCLDLFSKCVNLRDLTLKNCRSRGLKLMKILCLRLVCLSISNCWHSKYEILAPNLSSFYYEGSAPLVLSTGGLNSLEKVNLHMGSISISNKQMQGEAHAFMSMLSELRSAKSVILYGPVVEFFSNVLDLLENPPSPFYNLKCLRIEGLERPKKLAKKKLATSDMINQVVNYFLNSSPTATVSKEYRKEIYANKLGEKNGLDLAARASLHSELKELQKEVDDCQAYLTRMAPAMAEIAHRYGIPPPPPPPLPPTLLFNEASSYLATSASEKLKKLNNHIAVIRAYLKTTDLFLAESTQRCGISLPPSLVLNEASSSAPTSSNGPTVVPPFNDDGENNDKGA